MQRCEIINELRNIIADYLKISGLELIDLLYRYEARNFILMVLVDKPEGGISLGECAELNTQIGLILDEKDILQERYILEVSSPGLDRPLETKNDFLRCRNKDVRLFFKELINGKMELEGIIDTADEDAVYISVEDKAVTIPLSKITKAKQVI